MSCPVLSLSLQIIGENDTHIFVTFHIANLTRFATPPSSSTNVTANQAVLYILSNLASNGALPFSVALNSNTNVTPIFLSVSQRMSQPPPQGSCIHYSYPQQVMNCLTHSCPTVECQAQGYHTLMTVLPCHIPPALRLIIHDSTGEVAYNETLTQSQSVSIHGMAVFNVTIDHVSDKTIVVEVRML